MPTLKIKHFLPSFMPTSFCILLICLSSITLSTITQAQDLYSGRYTNDMGNVTLELKQQGEQYLGQLNDGQSIVQIQAHPVNGVLQGQVSDGMSLFPFFAQKQGEYLYISLAGMEFLFRPLAQQAEQTAKENHQPQRESNNNAATQRSPAHQKIGSAKLYWMRKTSVLSSNSGGYGEIDFCMDGRFIDFSEASVMVEGGRYDYNTGTHDSHAGAASVQRSSGQWQIQEQNGVPIVVARFADGSVQSVALQTVLSGTWFAGQIKYAMEWGGSRCR